MGLDRAVQGIRVLITMHTVWVQAGRHVTDTESEAVLRIVSSAVNGLWAVNPPALLTITLSLASCVKALSLRPQVGTSARASTPFLNTGVGLVPWLLVQSILTYRVDC
jgi:hypothetical protein